MLGLAPSARAAAELSAATGAPADTVAKWCHEQPRLPQQPPGQAARWRVGPATVLLVDEAAMLATVDLAALTAVTHAARAKLVLVGDPAQIGPVERAGGLLPALAARVGAVELAGIRRFTPPWEAAATQALRQGNPAVWVRYADHDRVHPAAVLDTALDAVHSQWETATAEGVDALMMARARTDVDALNQRARAAAVAARTVHGPVLARAGGTGRPGTYFARGATTAGYPSPTTGTSATATGSASSAPPPAAAWPLRTSPAAAAPSCPPATSRSTQPTAGRPRSTAPRAPTADVGILLAHPGMDREHLYVGMTRGRHANHVHLTTDPATDDLHRPRPPGTAPTLDDAVRTLQTATARVGAQRAAHTLLDQARDRAKTITRRRERDTPTPQQPVAPNSGRRASPNGWSRHWTGPAAPSQSGRSIEM